MDNELMIVLDNKDYMYFKTKCENIDNAVTEFLESCMHIGLNIDNVKIDKLILRNSDSVEICKLFGEEVQNHDSKRKEN